MIAESSYFVIFEIGFYADLSSGFQKTIFQEPQKDYEKTTKKHQLSGSHQKIFAKGIQTNFQLLMIAF